MGPNPNSSSRYASLVRRVPPAFGLVDSGTRAGSNHEVVEGRFRNLEPEILLVPERTITLIHFAPVCIRCRKLVVEFIGRLERRLHQLLREWTQLRAGGNEATQGGRVSGIILRLHVDVGISCRGRCQRLISLWQ